jgi:hypothetical protein
VEQLKKKKGNLQLATCGCRPMLFRERTTANPEPAARLETPATESCLVSKFTIISVVQKMTTFILEKMECLRYNHYVCFVGNATTKMQVKLKFMFRA